MNIIRTWLGKCYRTDTAEPGQGNGTISSQPGQDEGPMSITAMGQCHQNLVRVMGQ